MENPEVISARINKFRYDLKKIPPREIVRKHVICGDCYKLNNDLYFELRNEIAINFGLHLSQVILVGSAKLGFTIKIDQRYREFYDESDFDIAIISNEFFEKVWESVYEYKNNAGYWGGENSFKKYLFKGWIRPDFLPVSPTFKFASDWNDFFRSLTNSRKYGPYKISAGLYKSWKFLEDYQIKNVTACLLEEEGESA
ncbi:MAG: hypothetical protein JW891_17620 [Candidatus Lokiarchaeota archaeon]|nr:hypothetical protein [Candidatus Lokiarchaeota archaeon]